MSKRRRLDRRNNTTNRFQHKGAFKIVLIGDTNQKMIRFKKQFIFLLSFLFKIPAILSQPEVSNVNVSQQSFSSFYFFLSFFFRLLQKMSKSLD